MGWDALHVTGCGPVRSLLAAGGSWIIAAGMCSSRWAGLKPVPDGGYPLSALRKVAIMAVRRSSSRKGLVSRGASRSTTSSQAFLP